jgi:GT2 family glycosyltransferase
MTDIDVSVVVPSFKGDGGLLKLLHALREQSVDDSRYEVIVVDDASPEPPSAEVAALARVVRHEVNRGPAAARNTGMRSARGQILAFVDDDCEPGESWLPSMLTAFEDPTVVGVGGCMEPVADDGLALDFQRQKNPWEPLNARLNESESRLFRLDHYLRSQAWAVRHVRAGDTVFGFAGGNMAFRAETLEAVGGFNEDLRVGEDIDLCMRVVERGEGRLIYWPDAHVRHHIDASVVGLFSKSRYWGAGASRFNDASGVSVVAYPFPLLLGALVVALRHRPVGRVAVLAGAPLAFYPRWIRSAVRHRRPADLLNAHLQLLSESATNLGTAEGLLRSLPARRRARSGSADGER